MIDPKTKEILEETLKVMPETGRSHLGDLVLQLSKYASAATVIDTEGSEYWKLREEIGLDLPVADAFYSVGGIAALFDVFGIESMEELEMALTMYHQAFPKEPSQ